MTGIDQTIEAWAKIVIDIWEEKIIQEQILDTQELFDSLSQHLLKHSRGSIAKVEFAFKLYGIYVDMGVGKETARGNSGNLEQYSYYDDFIQSKRLRRKPQSWYSKVFYGQVKKLTEILALKYSRKAALAISEGLKSNYDQRFKSKNKHTQTIGSLRTEKYRDKQAIRNKRKIRK